MKKVIAVILILCCFVAPVGAESYKQCKKRVLADIAAYEQSSGKTVSKENKKLNVQVYCFGKS